MSMFFDTLPTNSHTTGNNKKKRNICMSLKPCDGKDTYYRVRLLAFSSDKTDRDDPFITRFVHQKWGTHPEKGYPMVVDEITCPVTPHVHVEGNRYSCCKMCDIANKYFIQFKESGWKDKDASKKSKEFGRKFQGIIPVYVINDPNYENNNNKFMVIIFNDKKKYEEFREKVRKQSMKQRCFNGKDAVDCCIHVSEVSETKNAGLPNEYTWKHREIDKIVFTTKPYDIPSITRETCESMGFDAQYYTTSTPDEIQMFYKKWCTVSNDDIPDDDSDIPVYDEPKKVVTPVVKPANDIPVATSVQNDAVKSNAADDIDDSDLDALTADIEGDAPKSEAKPAEAPKSNDNEATTDEVDDLLNGLDL